MSSGKDQTWGVEGYEMPRKYNDYYKKIKESLNIQMKQIKGGRIYTDIDFSYCLISNIFQS